MIFVSGWLLQQKRTMTGLAAAQAANGRRALTVLASAPSMVNAWPCSIHRQCSARAALSSPLDHIPACPALDQHPACPPSPSKSSWPSWKSRPRHQLLRRSMPKHPGPPGRSWTERTTPSSSSRSWRRSKSSSGQTCPAPTRPSCHRPRPPRATVEERAQLPPHPPNQPAPVKTGLRRRGSQGRARGPSTKASRPRQKSHSGQRQSQGRTRSSQEAPGGEVDGAA